MAFVTITEAAKLVRRSRRSLYRDIDRGRVSKTVSEDGSTFIDTSELLRAYGSLHTPNTGDDSDAIDASEIGEPGEARKNGKSAPSDPVEDFEDLVDSWQGPGKLTPEHKRAFAAQVRLRMMEDRIRSLQHVIELEANLRKVKDEVTEELRARLADKDRTIKILENQLLLIDYDRQAANRAGPKALLAKLFGHKRRA